MKRCMCYSIAIFLIVGALIISSPAFSDETKTPVAPVHKALVSKEAVPKGTGLVEKKPKFGEKEGEKIMQKTLSGTVGYYDQRYMALIYQPEDGEQNAEYEIGFNLNKNVALEGAKQFSDISRGDKVEVSYEEHQIEYDEVKKDGSKEKKTKLHEWKAQKIRFLKKGGA